MNSRSLHLVDLELREALQQMPPFDLTPETLPLIRAQMDAMAALPVADPYEVDVEAHPAPGLDGHAVEVVVYRPRGVAGPLPAVLQIHGGGYVMGSARLGEPLNRLRAAQARCVVVSVEYRLAPETPFPGPLEDCYAALAWMYRQAQTLGLDAGRIGVAGDSAGGGLAAALALLARDRGEYRLAFQHLVYPMLDDRSAVGDDHPLRGEFVWSRAANRFGWRALLGREPGAEDVPAYAAPGRATDLAGLPPTFIYVGALDLFLDEDVDYARRLIDAGVQVELHVYPGAYHGFEIALGAGVVRRAQREALEALTRALHPGGPD